jgi:P4 family phage/plasmid primase-like protien
LKGGIGMRKELERTCRALFAPGQIVELYINNYKARNGRRYKAPGWFDDHAALIDLAEHWDQKKPEAIHCTLNPVRRECLGRAHNKINESHDTRTKDDEILRRSWFFIDVDSVGSVTGVSASSEEVSRSKVVADAIAHWLDEDLGFPEPLRAFSGNGHHLLYRIDLPNDDQSLSLVGNALDALARLYSGPAAKIDSTVKNAARLTKLYGSWARKGEEIDDRLHRQSFIARRSDGREPIFDEFEAVTPIQLHALAERAPASPEPPSRRKRKSEFDLADWIDQHGIDVKHVKEFDSGKKFVLSHCVFDESHTGTSASLGQSKTGALWYQCFHNSCSDKRWADVREKFDGPKEQRKGVKAAVATKPAGKAKAKKEVDSSDPYDLAELVIEEHYSDEFDRQLLRHHGKTFFSYTNGGYYQKLTDGEVRKVVMDSLYGRIESVTRSKVGDVLENVRSMSEILGSSSMTMPFVAKVDADGTSCARKTRTNWLVMKNGILDLDEVIEGADPAECLRPHNPDYFNADYVEYPFPFKPAEKKCSRWLDFLADIMESDHERIAVLQEAMGYCWFGDNRFEKFFIFQGGGGNGKGTFLHVLRELVGTAKESVSLKQFQKDALLSRLAGARANLCGDLPAMESVEEDLIKQITSGDEITVDQKYLDPVTFEPTCKMFYATNPMPIFHDTTDAMWDRLMVVPFRRKYRGTDKQDTRLKHKLTKELPGIFLWTLEGSRRLMVQNGFTQSKICYETLANHRRTCFPILAFLDERTEDVSAGAISLRELWEDYQRWCGPHGLTKPKPMAKFLVDVERFRKSVIIQRDPHKPVSRAMIRGLRLRPKDYVDVTTPMFGDPDDY